MFYIDFGINRNRKELTNLGLYVRNLMKNV